MRDVEGSGVVSVGGWERGTEPSGFGVTDVDVVSSTGIDRGLVGWLGRPPLLGGRSGSSARATSSIGKPMNGEGALFSGLGTIVKGRNSPRPNNSSGSGSGRGLREWRK